MTDLYDYWFKNVILIDNEGVEWRGKIDDVSSADENFEDDEVNEESVTLEAYWGSEKFFNENTKGKTFLVRFYTSEIKSIEIIE